ncbi:MAG: metal ABC transporter ATP-binding protein [Actinomyces sp.]|uniref:metal ABC transporter ATP-binding protein n=1 Tax=Actinomyces sp. TaxID=29317 RepID=UPI001EBFC66B|nr:metal ABC transporter ATP-binding protein [Actinomyces sp.]MBS5827039.1 metal ABC transporter ATP-binding protein [Actinomyces sp.]
MVLSVSDVNVSFGNQQVLQDVSFSINRGELVGLLGPNGAGKTTLIRTILGLLRPDSGTIATAGPNTLVVEPSKPASKTPALAEASFKRVGCAIGYVPQKQEARWEYPITVEEVVISSLKPRFLAGAKHWRAAYEALDAVGMKEFRSRPISALSGGQRQRVLIARALAPKPSLLLLDEPFTGLDEPNQEALAKMAMELTNKGISILMSTHDLVQAAGMCDRFILLNRTVRAAGPLQNVAAPELWASTYEVSEDAALVRAVQSLTEVEVGA